MTPVVNASWRAGCIFFLFFIQFLKRRHHFNRQIWRGGTILLVILERMHHFIDHLREKAPFVGLILEEVGGTFLIYVQNYAGGWLEFHFMVRALPGRLVFSIKFFLLVRIWFYFWTWSGLKGCQRIVSSLLMCFKHWYWETVAQACCPWHHFCTDLIQFSFLVPYFYVVQVSWSMSPRSDFLKR